MLKDTRWLGKALLNLDIRKSNRSSRIRLYGHSNRWFDLNPTFVEEVLAEREEIEDGAQMPDCPGRDVRQAVAYCETTTCNRCPYASVCGSIMPEVREAKRTSEPPPAR